MILSIDYGRRRVGLALSDETNLIAAAIDPLEVKGVEELLIKVKKILETNKISSLVIGLPLGYDNKPTQMSDEILAFGKRIEEDAKIEVIFWNEASTSKIAKKIMNNKKGIDSNSARIILQEYLDHIKY